MAILPILCYPDPRLHTVAQPVAVVDERVRQLVADMLYRTDRESLNLESRYKSLEEWNYLFEVSLAMMLEEEYQVEVTPEDFDCTRTLGELFHRVCEPSLADKN